MKTPLQSNEFVIKAKTIEEWFGQKQVACALVSYCFCEASQKQHTRAARALFDLLVIFNAARPLYTPDGFICSVKRSPFVEKWVQNLFKGS